MFGNDTAVTVNYDAERFRAAFDRFLQLYPPPVDRPAWVTVQSANGEGMQSATLWSPAAAEAFRFFLVSDSLRASPPRGAGVATRFG